MLFRSLPTVFIVSDVCLEGANAPEGAHTETESGIGVLVEAAEGQKCDRCWTYVTDAISDVDAEGNVGCLCPRCHKVVY